MTSLEVLIAAGSNVICFGQIVCFIAMIAFVVSSIAVILNRSSVGYYTNQRDESRLAEYQQYLKDWQSIQKKVMIVALILLPFIFVPSLDDLWTVRINLMKLELASPENVKAGTEHITEVVKALECKYLDKCSDEKKHD